MKTSFHHRLAAVVVGIAAACSANATEYSSSSFVPLNYGPGLSQYGLFTNFYEGSAVGDTFVDDYFFNSIPPYSDVKASFYASLLPGGAAEVSFSSISFSIYQPGVFVPLLPLMVASTPVSLSGASESSIASGVYVFEITGTFLVDDAQYAGLLTDNLAPIPVPEPSAAWLLALGLAGVGVAKRKRVF